MLRQRKFRFKIYLKILLLTLIALVFIGIIDQTISPMVTEIAQQRVHNLLITKINTAIENQLTLHQEYTDYKNLMYIEKDHNGRIILMIPNTVNLNLLIAALTLEINHSVKELSTEEIEIPLGSISGNRLLATWGPNIPVSVYPISTINIQLIDDFVEAGINQTKHRIILEVRGTMGIAIPLSKTATEVSSQIILSESIIVGSVPQTYFNFK